MRLQLPNLRLWQSQLWAKAWARCLAALRFLDRLLPLQPCPPVLVLNRDASFLPASSECLSTASIPALSNPERVFPLKH